MNNNYTSVKTPILKSISFRSKNQIPQFPAATVIYKNLTNQPSHFLELSLFKQQLKHKPSKIHNFEEHARKVNVYRLIFFSLSLLFLILSAIIYYQNITFSALIFGELRILIRNSVCIFTGCIGLVAAGFGYSLCIVKESTGSLARKARRKLSHLYTKKQIEFEIKIGFWMRGNNKGEFLKLARIELLDKINEQKADTMELLREIHNSKSFDTASREMLFSQALAEMDEQIKGHLLAFKELKM